MAFPALTKTWEFNTNQPCVKGGGVEGQHVAYNWKESLIGFASVPWQVWGCSRVSGGAAPSYGNADGVDRWTDPSVLALQSWMVLTNPVTGAQLLWDLYYTDWFRYNVKYSPGGQFGAYNAVTNPNGTGADGDATTPPTAGDSVDLFPQLQYLTTNRMYFLHAMQSTDGLCTRWILTSGVTINFACLDTLRDPMNGADSQALIGNFATLNTEACTYAILVRATTDSQLRVSGTWCPTYLTTLMFAAPCFQDYWAPYWFGQDPTTLDTYFCPVGVYASTVGHRGLKGHFHDMWSTSDMMQPGTTYPSDGSKQYIQFGMIVVPWDGSIPLLGG